jgi:hypothetical protein
MFLFTTIFVHTYNALNVAPDETVATDTPIFPEPDFPFTYDGESSFTYYGGSCKSDEDIVSYDPPYCYTISSRNSNY